MRNNSAALCGAAFVIVLSTGSIARADLVHWTYSWSQSPNQVLSDTSSTSMINLSNASVQTVIGDSNIVSTNLTTTSNAPDGTPATFTNKAYVLSLTLTDSASGDSKTIQFSGVFNGTLSANSAVINNTFNPPTTQVVLLGNNRYTVSLPFYTPPGPPASAEQPNPPPGSIGAFVHVVEALPEPSSLFLAGLGVLLVGLMHQRNNWRRFPLLPA